MQEVNYSHNEIEEIPDLSVHQSLSVLTLDCILQTNSSGSNSSGWNNQTSVVPPSVFYLVL